MQDADGGMVKVNDVRADETGNCRWIATLSTTGFTPGRIYVEAKSTVGDGTLTYRTSATLGEQTGVGDRPSANPREFHLHQNVPNPFKPGETMNVAARPASWKVKILPLKKLKEMAL